MQGKAPGPASSSTAFITYPRPPAPVGTHGGHGSFSAQNSPSPNQGNQKRKRFSNHGGYNNNPAPTSTRPWTGMVQAWPVAFNAPASPGMAPGILGPRPSASTMHAYTAFAPLQYHSAASPYYAAPPSVVAAPTYGMPPPMPQYLVPAHFASPPTAAVPAPPSMGQHGASTSTPSFQQTALINALQDMSMHDAWVADSRASAHMTGNQGNLLHTRPVPYHTPVMFGNGDSLPITHIGNSHILSSSRSLPLNDVLVVPNLVKDLLSVRRFTTDNMLAMEFDAYGLSVKDYRTKEVLHRCDSTGDLYPIVSATPSSSPTAFTSTAVPQDTWHGRLGHPGITSSFNKRFPCNNSKNLYLSLDPVAPPSVHVDHSLILAPMQLHATDPPRSPEPPSPTRPPSPPSATSPPSTPPDSVPTPAQPNNPPSPPPKRTRLQHGIVKHRRLFDLTAVVPISPLPRTYRQALADPNWSTAMRFEHNALLQNNTWTLVPKPTGANIVSGKWVYCHKYHSDGSLARYKARWVVHGFSQEHDIDYDENFSPVIKPSTI
ncbi:hypothetical protein QYE76_013642 [Lolium multiflorum]|uniref:Reverse transcriptase Ty1/copia-type domain-containing protein n=1 Tax=Lolium multiflorum TaxID=4521 RepID=A0AAD8U3G2_LOLMU|nr:hypothetical protein QYE76_013642 [Lolium multiflorum]